MNDPDLQDTLSIHPHRGIQHIPQIPLGQTPPSNRTHAKSTPPIQHRPCHIRLGALQQTHQLRRHSISPPSSAQSSYIPSQAPVDLRTSAAAKVSPLALHLSTIAAPKSFTQQPNQSSFSTPSRYSANTSPNQRSLLRSELSTP